MKTRTVPLEQYLYHEIEDENEAQKYKKSAMPLIGEIVLNFNALEKDLDAAFCEIFTDRTDSTGLIVLHRMNYATKVDLFKRFNDDLFNDVGWVIPGHEQLVADLKECGRLRNLVVHADWENTDPDGYTYVRLNFTKDGMKQEYIQFSQPSLRKIIDLIIQTRKHLESFWETRNEKLART